MKWRYMVMAVTVSVIAQTSYAQYNQDALRFSEIERGSSARMKAIGNASTAVGGDISSISGNPAGLGFFNSSEFSLTPEFRRSEISSAYFGQSENDAKDRFNLNNVALVFNSPQRVVKGSDPTKGLLSINFGLSFSRTNSFHENSYFAGFNNNSSVADYFADIANTQGFSNPLPDWAYELDLITEEGSDQNGPTYASTTDIGSPQTQTQITSGGQSEFSLAMGANYSNKLYFGLGLGLTSLNYRSTTNFTEMDVKDIDYRVYYDKLQHTTGSGFNFKLGMIYKPVEAVRIGASYTSPTWYSMEDDFTLALETDYANSAFSSGYISEDYPQNYNLRTPSRLNGGIAVFLQQYGFISADVEYVNYSNIELSDYSDGSSAGDNRRIANLYKSVVNARIGAEGKFDNFYLRAGYDYRANPERGIGGATKTASTGIGYRMNNFYVDFTYANVTRTITVFPYEFELPTDVFGDAVFSPEASIDKKYNNGYLTVGFRF